MLSRGFSFLQTVLLMLRKIIIVLTCLIPSICYSASITERLDSLFMHRYENSGIEAPGGAVVISRGDSTIYEAYFGFADLKKHKKIDSHTTFNIASVSKQFTVAGLLQLAAKGLVDINAPLTTWFPELTKPFWAEITPVHLASQSSGIPDTRDRSSREACIFANDNSSAAYFPSVDSTLFKPGSAYDYVNPTFILLSRIIERVTNQEFIDYQRDNIFLPAGMNETYYFDPQVTPAAQSHAYQPSDNGWQEFDYGEETFFATRPDGGIYATARDMVSWEKALLDETVLSSKWLAEAYRPHVDVSSSVWCDYQRRPYTSYGLGWFIEDAPDRPLKIFHTGDNGGYQAYVAKYPASQISVIVLENRHDQPRRQMAEEIESILELLL